MPVGFLGFITFALYYLILKAVIQLINIESRRTGSQILAGVAGLFA